jgi:MFS family permease
LNEFYGWRITFAVLGAPGLVLAVLAWRTLRDPRARHGSNIDKRPAVAPPAPVQPSMKEVARTLLASRTFRHLQLCLAVSYFFSYGIGQWLPSFFVRSYGMSTGELGTWFAVTVTAAGLTGSYLAGEAATRLAPNNECLQLKGVALGFIVAGALMTPAYLVSNRYLAFLLLGLSSVGIAVANGPLFSTIQTLVPERMRAVAFAVLYLGANLVGMGLGPLAVGIMSDAFRTWAGEESLRYSLLALVPGYFWVSWHAWRAAATVTAELKAKQPPGLAAAVSYSEAARVGLSRR